MAGQGSRLPSHGGYNYNNSDGILNPSSFRPRTSDLSKTFTSGTRAKTTDFSKTHYAIPHKHEENGPGAQSIDMASTHGTLDYKPNALRSLIHVLEGLKGLNLDEAKSLYEELMKKTNRHDELEREKKYLKEKEKREANYTSKDRHSRTEVEEQRQRSEHLQEENRSLTKKMDELQMGMAENQKKYESTKAELEGDIARLKMELQQNNKDLSVAVKEKNDALTRLSREMGTKLNDNNPAIADLSDPNRATKIAEKYNELYDNQWTDAMEGLTTYQEKEAIKILLNILKECYQTCEETAAKQLESLQVILRMPTTSGNQTFQWSPSKVGDRIEKTTNKMLKDCRKLMAEEAVEDIAKKLVKRHSRSVDANFVMKCVELCWLMAVQDPPVVLGKEALCGEKFNADEYREYTSTGSIVEYTVWLPLMLHKNGPLLCKGVAQPVKRPNTAPAAYRASNKPHESYYPKEERYKPNLPTDVTYGQMSHDVFGGRQGTNVDAGATGTNYVTEVVQPKYGATAHRVVTYKQEPQGFRTSTYGNTDMLNEKPRMYDFYNRKLVSSFDRNGTKVYYSLFDYRGSLCAEYNGEFYYYKSLKEHLGLRD